MTKATKNANDWEKNNTDGEPQILRTSLCGPILQSERAVQMKRALKVHGKCRSKKDFGSMYKMLPPGLHILKVSPTTSSIKEPGKAIVTVRNRDMANLDYSKRARRP